MKEDGKLFEHKHGDYYTHEPVKKWKEEIEKNIIRNKLGLRKKYFIDDATHDLYLSELDYNRGRGRFTQEGFNKALYQKWLNNGKQKLTQDNIREVVNAVKGSTYSTYRPMQISGGGVMGGNDYGFA